MLIYPIVGANVSVTGVPTINFLVQSMMEVDPTVALLKVGMYTTVEVSDAVMVKTHASDQRYQYCNCGPYMGLMGLEDLTAALGPDTSDAVVVIVDTRAMEVLQTDCSALQSDYHVQNALFCHKNSMLDVCSADIEYGSQAICVVHLLHLNP